LHDLIVPLEVVIGLVILCVVGSIILAGFVVRRRVLARNPATFDCSLRRDRSGIAWLSSGRSGLGRKPGGWMLGVARYEEDRLEWFRIFTLDPRPGRILQRAQMDLVEWRQPSEDDSHSLLPETVIVRCSYDDGFVELAMTRSDYTTFATWLESAPPGKQPFES
jgi:hypothetical protein